MQKGPAWAAYRVYLTVPKASTIVLHMRTVVWQCGDVLL